MDCDVVKVVEDCAKCFAVFMGDESFDVFQDKHFGKMLLDI